MNLIPDPLWLPWILALILLADAAMSIKPMGFIRRCLEGVDFPQNYWWSLIVIKMMAAIGIIAGSWIPGIGLAACVGVVLYFLCATVAHIRARFTGMEFRVNCLGMLALSSATLLVSYLAP